MQQLKHAARALGWRGSLITDIDVLGARFSAVTRLRPEVHRWRTAHGWHPHTDPARLNSWSEPAEHDHVPVAAVDLVGVLVTVSKARKGLRACGSLMTLAPCAIVLPGAHPYQPWPLTELDFYGVGVVRSDDSGPADVVLPPEDRRSEFGATLFGRWLLEVLYCRMLDHPEPAGRAENAT